MTARSRTPNRRKRRFVRPDIQLKVVFVAAFVSCLTLVVQMQLAQGGVGAVARNLGQGLSSFQVLDLVESVTARSLMLAIVVALPLSLVVGVLYSFRFAGPIVRLQRHLEGLRDGAWDERCVLRKGDDLHDVAHAVNEVADVVRARVGEDRALLSEVRQLLTSSVFTTDGATGEEITRLVERLDAAETASARDFAGVSTVEGAHALPGDAPGHGRPRTEVDAPDEQTDDPDATRTGAGEPDAATRA